jgi:uncharacterized membrane protein (DUF106 family)
LSLLYDVISAVYLLPYLIYLLHFSLCHLHVVFVASLFLNIISETQAAQITRDKVSQTTKELEQAQQELRSVQEIEEAANKKIQSNLQENQELEQTAKLPYLIYLLHFSLCHLHVVFVASLFLLLFSHF